MMLLTIARILILVAGAALAMFVCVGIASPARVLNLVSRTMASPWGIAVAVGVRLVLGVALLVAAPASPFPLAFTVVGWIAIAAAVIGLLLGRQRLQQFTQWWIDRFGPTGTRAWLVIAFAFSIFLVYGVA